MGHNSRRRRQEPTEPHLVSFHVTHRWTSPELLGRYTRIPAEKILRAVSGHEAVQGAVALVTCHRAELYLETDQPDATASILRGFFRSQTFRDAVRKAPAGFRPESALHVLRDEETLHHLFRVAAGLDSILLGEREILGQVRRAYRLARDQRTIGGFLDLAFQRAIALGRFARTQPGFGFPKRSYAAEAVAVLKERLGGIRGRRVVLVGAGSLAADAARLVRQARPARIIVVNRHADAGRRLASMTRGDYRPLRQITALAGEADGIVLAVRSGRPLLDLAKLRSNVPVIVDLSNPSVVQANGHAGNLVGLDEVAQRVLRRHQPARAVIESVESMAQDATQTLLDDKGVSQEPVSGVLRALNASAAQLAEQETAKALRKLRHLSAEDQGIVRELARSLHTKLFRAPTIALKEVEQDRREDLLDAARVLFRLSPNEKEATG